MKKAVLTFGDLVPYEKDALATLLGVLLLEYHDKNFLAGDEAVRAKAKIELAVRALEEQGKPLTMMERIRNIDPREEEFVGERAK